MTKKPLKLSYKVLVITIAVGLVAGFPLGYVLSPKAADKRDLEQRVNQLEEWTSTVKGQMAQRDAQIASLNSTSSGLNSSYMELLNRYNQLNSSSYDLLESISGLEQKYSALNSSYNDLLELVITEKEWHEVIHIYEETGTTQTRYSQVFNIPSNTWRIIWHFSGSEFLGFWVWVYPEGVTSPIAQFGEITWDRADITNIDVGPGNFYLKIWVPSPDYINFYEVTVEAYS